jgi:hypothetical protein
MDIFDCFPLLKEDGAYSKIDSVKLVEKIISLLNFISDEDLTMARYFYEIEKTGNTAGVYFIKNKYTGLVKIGCTSNIKVRYAMLDGLFRNQFGAPDALQILDFLLINPRFILKVEKMIHATFSNNRRYGEWFEISNDDIESSVFGDIVLNSGVRITSFFNDDIYKEIDYKNNLLRSSKSVSVILSELDFIKWLFANYRGDDMFNDKIIRAINDISPDATSCTTLWWQVSKE